MGGDRAYVEYVAWLGVGSSQAGEGEGEGGDAADGLVGGAHEGQGLPGELLGPAGQHQQAHVAPRLPLLGRLALLVLPLRLQRLVLFSHPLHELAPQETMRYLGTRTTRTAHRTRTQHA